MRRPTPTSTLSPYTTLIRSHHPYFQRSLTDQPDQVELEIPCTQYMDLSAGVPTKAPEPVPARLDFTHLRPLGDDGIEDRKSTHLNSSHRCISYAVFCLKKKK